MNGSHKIKGLIRFSVDMLQKFQNPHSIPVVYFSGTPNVGDLLNGYLIPKMTGKDIVKVTSSMTPHMRAIGSVIGSASQFSYVWGSGSIDGRQPNRKIRKECIYALRGTKTQKMLSSFLEADLTHLPLGDPAVLTPDFYMPLVEKVGHVGIIPHFSDEAIITDHLASAGINNVRIISVRQNPEEFITELCGCDYVFSSSLHGLVLADSYEVPNKWISVSNLLLGGAYKFQDYYSTTDTPDESYEEVLNPDGFHRLIDRSDVLCSVKTYISNKSKLRESFPFQFTDRY